ncbi:MAG TPA: hypothetical protein VFV50_00805 [Bdellovibrionales bacterium]|nr:hypothetical protein [Bdellovibrionales bacterium]
MALLVFLLMLIGLLSIPVDLKASSVFDGAHRFNGRVEWLWGLVGFELKRKREAAKAPGTKPGSVRDKKPERRGFSPLKFFSAPGMVPKLWHFVVRLLRAIHLRKGFLRLRLGLESPGETGQVLGLWHSLRWPLLGPRDVPIELVPAFDGPHLSWIGHGEARIYPAEVLGVTLAFLLSPSVARGAYAAWT